MIQRALVEKLLIRLKTKTFFSTTRTENKDSRVHPSKQMNSKTKFFATKFPGTNFPPSPLRLDSNFSSTLGNWCARLRSERSGFELWPGTVPLSTQVYKWVPANLMLGVTLRWTSIPSRGSRNTPSRFTLLKPG